MGVLGNPQLERLVAALQIFPPRATVHVLVQTLPSDTQVMVHGPSHWPRRTSQNLVSLAQTPTVSIPACFLIV